ncbi:MAG: hypothetical protein AAF366_20230 [Pseudomonadota bacterium]
MAGLDFNGTCGTCKRDYVRPLTKYEAAFLDSLKIDTSCPHCGGSPSGSSYGLPDIDLELLEAWYREGLQFLDQDEEIIIAGTDLSVFKAFIGTDPDRATAVAEALAIKFYDDDFETDDDREWTADWLIENQEVVTSKSEDYILKELDRRIGKRLEAKS